VTIANQQVQVMATRQKCVSSCSGIYAFTALLFIFLLCTMMNTVPVLSATLRCVSSEQRTFALGAQTLIWRLLGTIPGPVVFGAFIDRSCALWQTNCGQMGNCLAYDNESFSKAMVGLCFTNICLALCSATSAWWLYKSVKKMVPQTEAKTAYDNPCVDPS
jgi:solute carrier organic anion transporter family, member 4A